MDGAIHGHCERSRVKMEYLLRTRDVAMLFSITEKKVESLVKSDGLPHVPFPSGEIRFIEADVLQWAKSRTKQNK